MAEIARLVVLKSLIFRDMVEMERTNLSLRSRKLFTLSAIHAATKALLAPRAQDFPDDADQIAICFWEEVSKQFDEWQAVRDRRLMASEVRTNFIHSHGVALQAIGRVGQQLIQDKRTWKRKLKSLRNLDWSRGNARLWEGRAMIGGRISKADSNVILTTNVLKNHLGLTLTPEEHRLEEGLMRGSNGVT